MSQFYPFNEKHFSEYFADSIAWLISSLHIISKANNCQSNWAVQFSIAAVCMLYLFTTKLLVACCTTCTSSAKLLALLAHFIFWLTMESPFNPIDGSDTYWYYITKTRWMNTLGTFYGSANNCQLYVKNCMHSKFRPIAMFENMQVVNRTFIKYENHCL